MKHYSDDQLDILKRLASGGSVIADDSNRQDCIFLRGERLLRLKQVNGLLVARITPEGMAYIKTLQVDVERYAETAMRADKALRNGNIALFLSATSIFISLIALLR